MRERECVRSRARSVASVSKGLEAGSSVDVPARLDHAEEDFLEHTERQAE